MAMQHSEHELKRLGDSDLAKIQASLHEAFKKRHPELGDIALPSVAIQSEKPTLKTQEAPVASNAETVKMYPEISLEQEWQRQTQGLVELGFHTELGLTEEKYLESLPKFTPQPESFKGRLDTPVIVEARISPKRQSALAGIRYVLDGLNKTDWNQNLKGYTAPDAPYAAWLEDGRHNLNRKPKDVRVSLKADEIAGTEFDGIALYVSNPKILEHHSLDLPGTSVGSGRAADLRLWGDEPRLLCGLVDYASPRFGSVVRGRQK